MILEINVALYRNLNKNKIFPKGMELYQEGYIHALEWVLE